MKTQEELRKIKKEYETLTTKLKELTEDELKEVTGGGSYPIPTPVGLSVSGSEIVARAQSCIDKPYAWGAVGPNGYDDSGLVSYCISGTHSRIGTCDTFMSWPRVSNPMLGDICVSANHCGIYVGGGVMIHALTFGQVVCQSSIQPGMVFVRP